MKMNETDRHGEWLGLLDISGPFLATPVLDAAFPQGLDQMDPIERRLLRQAYDEWREAVDLDDPQLQALHRAWIELVLERGLDLDEDGEGDVLKPRRRLAESLVFRHRDCGVTLVPDYAVVDDRRGDQPLLLVAIHGADVDLDAPLACDGWAATPAERMVQLCRHGGCRLGLVTNGERWMLVDAPVGGVSSFASWYARLWGQEPVTLQGFVHLLGIRRFFDDRTKQLPALLDSSLQHQDQVTTALGEQVRRAVEVLIQALDKADQDRDRELLRGVKEAELYEAALTVMMRLVFLLSAEERGLLLLGDERYEANYALSTLRMQLRAESDEILERRWDAWSRLLALFRAVYGGIEHENLRLPALGGSLFDPDRFPFLEGRAKGSDWRTDLAKPLPIDNRTVRLLLEAIQQFQGRTLSYWALDVEQIGYVYEGLLERTVKRTSDVTLELDATKSAQSPWVTMAELESARLDGADRLAGLLQERSGSSASRVHNDLAKPVDDALADRLLAACHGDTALRDRIKPFGHLVRTDPWGYPLVYPAGASIVTTGSDRRETGTHYTPKSLTEAIVTETLTPIGYVGPAEGAARADWTLKSPAQLLDLKICDPAMGSGAFLVQACRWLADRLVEAWAQAEAQGHTVGVDGRVADANASMEPLPRDTEARTIIARRLIAERCLYGVDLNPLAVELAKLSIWLVTLAKGRPFGFLDHSLRCGDSLLGIHRLDQLTELTMNPTGKGQRLLFGQNIERAVREAIELRMRLRETPIRDIRDVEAMAHLDADARRRLEVLECIADAFIGEVLASGGNGAALENALALLTVQAGQVIDGDRDVLASMRQRSVAALSRDLPAEKLVRRLFHWPLEFPEIFARDNGGFDALVGNPPFMGGKKISGNLGKGYREYVADVIGNGVKGNADLCAYFYLRVASLLRPGGTAGLLATNTIAQGDTREVGLDQLVAGGIDIPRAVSSRKWPGNANLEIAQVWLHKGDWRGPWVLDDRPVSGITPYLSAPGAVSGPPKRIKANEDKSFIGSYVLGMGFVLEPAEAEALLAQDPRHRDCLFPYLNGEDLNSRPDQSPSRWVINFHDWPLDRSADGCWAEADDDRRKDWLRAGRVPKDYPDKVAADYPVLLGIIEEKVKPERDWLRVKKDASAQGYARLWWRYARTGKTLYSTIERMERALVRAQVSRTHAPVFEKPDIVFSMMCVVFAIDLNAEYAVLQSNVHECWVGEYSSSLKRDQRYTPTDCFETFPFPASLDGLDAIGERYYRQRQSIMQARQEGLTKTYNHFHDPDETAEDIATLRALHVELDQAVVAVYGWTDLDLGHAFHDTKQGLRYTLSDPARRKVLDRLLALNFERYAEEVAEGLPGHAVSRSSRVSQRARRTTTAVATQTALDFGVETPLTSTGISADPFHVVLEFLKTRPGWHAKADVVSATGLTGGQWNTAIADLSSRGLVERQGERRGARYRIGPERTG